MPEEGIIASLKSVFGVTFINNRDIKSAILSNTFIHGTESRNSKDFHKGKMFFKKKASIKILKKNIDGIKIIANTFRKKILN